MLLPNRLETKKPGYYICKTKKNKVKTEECEKAYQ